MEWIRSNLAAAKSGDLKARLRLAIPFAVFALALYLQFGSEPKTVSLKPKSSVASKVQVIETRIFVHIVGEVLKPGVYPLESGARMYDLIAMAGGFSKSADQSSVNLARTLNDGEQIQVYGEGLGVQAGPALLNLNRSSAAELENLPGVGPKLAGRIIDWRTANGGFSSIDQLRRVGGIGDKLFAGLKDLVTI